jgi:limonene-1,2-epoxide hydrolase
MSHHGSKIESEDTSHPRATTSEERLILEFLERFNLNRIDSAIDLLHENVLYHNIPMEPMRGREKVRSFTHGFGVGTRFKAEWRTMHIASKGNVVLTERVDAFSLADGRRIAIPLMGAFRVEDGFITEWRDYFDMADFTRQFGAMSDAK